MKRMRKFLSQLPTDVAYDFMDSPVGSLLIFASDKGLYSILWEHETVSEECQSVLAKLGQNGDHPIIMKTKQQLREYFARERTSFDIPLCACGTEFQKEAWKVLSSIPYGETISYGEQAKRLGDKNKSRAVGMANGLNPISIVVPCHRVIGSNGSLTGFGGGLENKAKLIALEKASLA